MYITVSLWYDGPMDTNRKPEGQRLQELRRSSAAGKHGDRRTKRARDRSARERAARRDQED